MRASENEGGEMMARGQDGAGTAHSPDVSGIAPIYLIYEYGY